MHIILYLILIMHISVHQLFTLVYIQSQHLVCYLCPVFWVLNDFVVLVYISNALKRLRVSLCVYLLFIVEVSQSCPTLWDPMDCSLPGSFVHGILQARILERVAIPFPRGLPDPGIEPRSPALQASSLPSNPPEKPQKCMPNRCHSNFLQPTELDP